MWARELDEVVQLVEIDKLPWGGQFNVWIGVWVRSLDPEVSVLPKPGSRALLAHKCHLYFPQAAVLRIPPGDLRSVYDLERTDVSDAERSKELDTLMRRTIAELDALRTDEQLRAALRGTLTNGMLRLEARRHLLGPDD